jgi:IMP and pyridine-specific 5'-nucleotidase
MLLDTAEESLRDSMDKLKMRATVIRKDRAVGMISGGESSKSKPGHGSTLLRRESLDESCLRVLDALRCADLNLPYCAFNGGQDVWVDVGNKRVGVQALQQEFGIDPCTCLHVGDQMWETGNDFAARSCCPTVWIANPRETHSILKSILKIRDTGLGIETSGAGSSTACVESPVGVAVAGTKRKLDLAFVRSVSTEGGGKGTKGGNGGNTPRK